MANLNSPMTYSSALGDGLCLAGTFRAEFPSGALQWSDEMYRIHGYGRGEVVPTLELLYSHKHPDDRQRCQEIVAKVLRHGGYFCMYHRVIDAQLYTRHVLTSGDAIVDSNGTVTALEGILLDVSTTLRRETEEVTREAVVAATATRGTIDQARGILMGRLLVGSDDAFQMLVAHSSHRNIKLAAVAAEILRLAQLPEGPSGLDILLREMQARAVAPSGKVREFRGRPRLAPAPRK
ncbi:PAS and ANTAR domain-containing protein [Pseudarthrobacter sulfonivorans]|uniref:PAS and ANTAR domain-containing protein n=1 Tax=Pseudarthrobacter sulfonivorans TaxID=121292 RepID=UPI002102F524|nr:PAS and ANTAR domain-containing protein [Pseudarthrobacter sulfonivorans]